MPPHSKTRRPIAVATGLIALDVILSDADRQPWVAAGGTCGNVVAILSYLGWDSYPIARLNGDPAANLLRRDLKRWQVHLDYTGIAPSTDAPVILQRIQRPKATGGGRSRFSLKCPSCRGWLPGYRAVTASAADEAISSLPEPSVFFFDRLSRGALVLAQACREKGALVYFEPLKIGDERLFHEAIELVDVLKYSSERLPDLSKHIAYGVPPLEIVTDGADGLRFRGGLSRKAKRWRRLAAIPSVEVVDPVGAGDWLTAGLLHCLGATGREGLENASWDKIEHALRYGQAAAAWACGYEGARGAMVRARRESFKEAVAAALDGRPWVPIRSGGRRARPSAQLCCAACGSRAASWAR